MEDKDLQEMMTKFVNTIYNIQELRRGMDLVEQEILDASLPVKNEMRKRKLMADA
jgi:hypothetical protein